jgi:uncharacterized protein YjiK
MKYLWTIAALAILALGVSIGINVKDFVTNPDFTYNLAEPLETIKLPKALKEISGLTWWDDNQVAGIQDEDGFVFIIDVNKEEIVEREKFTKDGDYEGIALAKNKLYITRSDGKLFRVKSFDKKDQKTKDYKTDLGYANDIEGLCYDPIDDALLLVCKEKSGIKKNKKHKRAIFAFDLKTKELRKKPWMLIDTRELKQFVFNETGSDKKFNFRPSGIEVHPITGNLFIISAVGHLIIEIDRTGKFIACSHLPRKDFKQPEGITFDPEGNLYISNEGRDKSANILKFGANFP